MVSHLPLKGQGLIWEAFLTMCPRFLGTMPAKYTSGVERQPYMPYLKIMKALTATFNWLLLSSEDVGTENYKIEGQLFITCRPFLSVKPKRHCSTC